MSNSFREALKTEELGMSDILPLLECVSFQGRFILVNSGARHRQLQRFFGDAILNIEHNKTITIELKVDETDHPNFFIEYWSNRHQIKHGWLHYSRSDFLWYYFRKNGQRLFAIHLPTLQDWALKQGEIYRFRLARQNAYDQENDTWGFIVPCLELIKTLGGAAIEVNLSGFDEHSDVVGEIIGFLLSPHCYGWGA